MTELVLLLLATFWAWQTIRYSLENFLPQVFSLTRPLHPLVVAALPLYVLWPDWVSGLGVAGATGLLVGITDHFFNSSPVPTVIPRRRNRGGLPPLP